MDTTEKLLKTKLAPTLVLIFTAALLVLFPKTAYAQCCNVPADCPSIPGYTARCEMHDPTCVPGWRCSYTTAGGGGGVINWFDLERISAGRFASQPVGFVVTVLLRYLFPLAGLLLLLYLLYGGYRLMFSRGDPKAMQEAKSIITFALTGFLIVFLAYWVVQLTGRILGIPDIVDIFG